VNADARGLEGSLVTAKKSRLLKVGGNVVDVGKQLNQSRRAVLQFWRSSGDVRSSVIVTVEKRKRRSGRVRQNGVERDDNLKARIAAESVFSKEVKKNSTQGRPDDAGVKAKANRRLQKASDTQAGNAGGPR